MVAKARSLPPSAELSGLFLFFLSPAPTLPAGNEWPQRTAEQLASVRDQQVIVSLVAPGQRKYYDGLPDAAVLEQDIRQALAPRP